MSLSSRVNFIFIRSQIDIPGERFVILEKIVRIAIYSEITNHKFLFSIIY